ncbi:MAG TPA: hypothetical protein VIV09_07965 [Pseudolabrys sp.]
MTGQVKRNAAIANNTAAETAALDLEQHSPVSRQTMRVISALQFRQHLVKLALGVHALVTVALKRFNRIALLIYLLSERQESISREFCHGRSPAYPDNCRPARVA